MYKVKYKMILSPFWKELKVSGHHYNNDSDRMDFFLSGNKGIVSIAPWRIYHLKFGEDFFAFQKEQAEQSAGQTIPIRKNEG